MTKTGESYKHYIPDIGLAIERNTDNIPSDGKYYLLLNGEIISIYGTLKMAELAFKQKLDEIGYKPKPRKNVKSKAQQNIDSYLDSKDIFWAEGPISSRGRGGGRRGGV